MKKFLVLLSIFFATTAIAHTIDWYVDGQVYQTTSCESGDSVTPPTPPAKYGYTFTEWLPYIPIEYLESTGTQYIDTGYVANLGTHIVSTEIILSVSPISDFAGCGADSGGLHFVYDPSCKGIRTGGAGADTCILDTLGNKVIIHNYYDDQGRRVVQIGERKSTGTQGLYPNITTAMFGLKNGQGVFSNPGRQRIYSFVIYDNNTLIHDFIPVLDSNGVACMFDKVSRTFFYNSGTGNFIAGPVLTE